MSTRHLIGKQFFHLELPKAQNSFDLQQEVSKLYWEKMIPVLDQLFDKFSDSDKLIRIDRLDIDLGEIKLSDIQEAFPRRLYSALEEVLLRQIVVQSKELDRVSIPESHFEKWFYFLQTGALPWNAKTQEEAERLKSVFDTLGTHQKAINRLSNLLQTKPKALQRFILQHDDIFLKTIIELFTGSTQNSLLAAQKEIEFLFTLKNAKSFIKADILREFSETSAKYLFWKLILPQVIFTKSKAKWPTLVYQVLSKISKQPITKQKGKNQLPINKSSDFPILKKAVQITPDTGETAQSKKQKEEQATALQDHTNPSIEAEGYYIQNAGVILIHPFLAPLFKSLGWTINNAFKSESHRQKAIHLIQYLASGETEQAEYQLLLPKQLCNLAFDIPIERNLKLREAEKAEAEKMLEAAIHHWKALGEVSADSLREGFLKRSGKLEKRQNGWHLKMEQKSIDILLNKLPWNLSMVKLPWMPDILRVEWV